MIGPTPGNAANPGNPEKYANAADPADVSECARAGFTLVELIVAVILLLVVAVSLVGSSRIVTGSLQRATLELRAAQLIQEEVHRLRTLPVASLADGTATHPGGTSTWLVTDSGAYLRVELAVSTAPVAGISLADTLFLYRTP